ncbi:MAG: TonB-dependent receptor [Pseudomonadales bacterium]|nr:TonB-dependent receptor [Pseudomonadales bacterium]
MTVATLTLLLTLWLPTEVVAKTGDDDHDHHDGAVEEVIVQATRSRQRVQDAPIRVEVLDGEEIEEKLLMRPGNISMMLNETGGLRVQVTSPALGSANVRIHGMRGRYTQLLADGLPLYGGQAASLGLLQVPPSDLGQVEVIKGSSSALYGGQALGGVINLVSKRPSADASGEIIANTTTRDAQDLSAYLSSPLSGGWSGSVLSSFNRQTLQDLDDDDWIDMPGYDRFLIRPRLFYDGSDGARAYVTVGAMTEERRGGTVSSGVVASLEPFEQNQDTRRFDVGFVGELPVADWGYAQFRASGMRQSHDHRFGNLLEKDEHETALVEASLTGETSTSAWVGGVTYQADEYDPETFSAFNYSYETPAVFAQLEHDFSADISAALSARWDDHSEYGGQFSPRLSLLYRPDSWTFRASWGRGFYAPTPFVEETEAAGLSRLEAIAGLDAEIAETLSLDFGYSAGALEMGLTLFGSNIEDAVRLQTASPNSVRLINQLGITRTRGVETLIRWRRTPYVITASYLNLDASEPGETLRDRRTLPLTPQHSLGLVAMWEQHDRGRVGLELYYTGKQSLQDNPYRNSSEPYLHIGLLGEIVLGRYRLFLNLENLLNVRQTREDTLLQPTRRPNGQWTVDAWAPLEGFIANAGVRVRLGR